MAEKLVLLTTKHALVISVKRSNTSVGLLAFFRFADVGGSADAIIKTWNWRDLFLSFL